MNDQPFPPKLFLHFFRWYCHPKLADHIEGDLLEDYGVRLRTSGKRKADIRFIVDVLLLFRRGIIRPTEGYQNLNNYGMFKSYFKIGWRNTLKNRGYSLLNLGGLTLGITCFSIILLFVEHEFSFDRFHHDAENIYRVVKDFGNEDGSTVPDATTPPALAKALREELSEVQQSTRFAPNRGRLYLIQYGDKRFYETGIIGVDNSFFDVFDFTFVAGNKQTALKEIHSVVMTETTAIKYFGDEDPINKVIRMNVNNGTDFIVSGILKDVPENSHFQFDLIIPTESRINLDENWDRSSFYTYVRLNPNSDPVAFESNVKEVVKKHRPNSLDRYYTQRLLDIHLNSKLKWELGENGDLLNVKIFIAIGLFVILIASINYINLVTSQSAKRAKEIGVRKVSGASRRLLVWQFLTESVLTAVCALIFSVILTLLVLPFSSSLLSIDLSPFLYQSHYYKILLPCGALLIGILGGLYPAFILSAFKPIRVLKGNTFNYSGGIRLRQGLVVFQFVMSSSLIIGALVVIQQLNFLKQKQLGFNKENVLMLPNVRGGIGRGSSNPGSMLEEMKKISTVRHVARADGVFGYNNSTNGVSAKDGNSHITLNFIRADYEFLPAMEMRLKEGRNFSENFPSDSTGIILNEKAVSQLGLQRPYIVQQIFWDDGVGSTHAVNLIGVVEDFHFTSLREAIKPFGFILEIGNGSTFFLKVESQNLKETIANIEKVWVSFNPDKPFEYSFQDEQFEKYYSSEAKFQNLFSVFTVLAIFITCLGMFALVAFLAETKTKEIGIRKVLGASVNGIVILLSRDFVLMVIISFAISFPIGYYVMDGWLQGFAYKNEIGWEVFVVCGVVTLFITLITVSYQTIKAALASPVNSLKSE